MVNGVMFTNFAIVNGGPGPPGPPGPFCGEIRGSSCTKPPDIIDFVEL